MSYQTTLKYCIPAVVAVLLMLIGAWAFNLSPVAARAERVATPLESQTPDNGQLAGIQYDVLQVTGTGIATGTPDLAELSLTVSVTAATVAEARNDAAESMAAVRSKLIEMGIASKDIATSRFSIHPAYEYGADGREHTGYTASNGITVTVRNIDDVGTMIDSAVAAGGDHLVFDYLDFRFSDTSKLEREARQNAMSDMKNKAGQIAAFSNRTLGDLKAVSEGSADLPVGPLFELAGVARMAAADVATPISVGEDTVQVTVYGTYELRR